MNTATLTTTTPSVTAEARRGARVAPARVRMHHGPTTVPVRHGTTPRHPEAVYRRRRLVVGTIAAVLVVAGGLAVNEFVVGDSDGTASAAVAGPPAQRVTVTAQPGDTLWSIAQTHRGSVDVYDYIDRLVRLNDGPAIQAGQSITLP